MELSILVLFIAGAGFALILCAALIVGAIFLIRHFSRNPKNEDKEFKKMKIEDL